MIVIDRPWSHPRYGQVAHLLSDLAGADGTHELLDFAAKLGHRVEWLQRAGTEYEHFDVIRSRIARAIRLGATPVDHRRIVAIIRQKRVAA